MFCNCVVHYSRLGQEYLCVLLINYSYPNSYLNLMQIRHDLTKIIVLETSMIVDTDLLIKKSIVH